MHIAVIGKSGQVASALREAALGRGVKLTVLGRPQFDLESIESIGARLASEPPNVLINAAAYTAVDKAERDEAHAMRINGRAAGELADLCRQLAIQFIHLSTDYVFDGGKSGAWTEKDVPSPRSAYGRSKLAGERLITQSDTRHVIVRTSWVYSPFGANFVKTMLRLASERDEVSVVSDQVGSPTSAIDLANILMNMAIQLLDRPRPDLFGVFHACPRLMDGISWADFAERIFAISRAAGGPYAKVRRISTSDFSAPAPRPANSLLSPERLHQAYGQALPDLDTSLQRDIGRILEELRSQERQES